MPKLGLRPYATIDEGLESYIGYNFARLENVFERTQDVMVGSTVVTGDATIATGLATVDGCVACLGVDPSANSAFVQCSIATTGQIRIRVFTSAFAVSVTAVTVRWVAVGELVLT
jgi:hypothetical protein